MMISTKGRYALRVLIDMAEHQTDGYIPLKEIAKRQDISEKYLESIVKSLVKGGVVEGMRGKGGRLPPVQEPRPVHRRPDPAADGGLARPRRVPRGRQLALRPRRGVPHTLALGGTERCHQ